MTTWMEIIIQVPDTEGSDLLPLLRRMTGIKQIDEDWTVEKREQDNATVEYHPCPEPRDRKVEF